MTSFLSRFSNSYQAAKKAWQTPAEQKIENAPSPKTPQPLVNIYYVDSLAKVGEEVNKNAVAAAPASDPSKGRLEIYYEQLSNDANAELAKKDLNFDKLHDMIYKVIMMMMRMGAKTDAQRAREFNLKIEKQAVEIQATYNNWQGKAVTYISAGIGFAGAGAGLSPFIPFMTPTTIRALVHASQPIGTASTSLSSIGSLFDKKSEASRSLMQTYQRIYQDKEEECKSAKHSKSDQIKSAKSANEEAERMRHQSTSSILG